MDSNLPIMFWIGLAALAGGLVILLGRGGSEGAMAARRISGVMIAALGIFLMVFGNGLAPGKAAQGTEASS